MVYAMIAHIIFPDSETRKKVEIRKVTRVRIESGWEMLTSTAEIVIARNVKFFDKLKVKQVFKKGDPVEIHLGYDQTYIKEFVGYITEVSATAPITIKCEDAMYLLKRHPVNVSFKETSVSALLDAILPEGFKYDAIEAEIGTVRYAKTTVSQVLEKLKDDFGLYSYIKDFDTLVVGKIYQDDDGVAPVKFNLNKNVASDNLNYKSKEDLFIKVKAVSTLKNGDKLEVEVGDDNGVQKQLSYYNITSKIELKKLAQLDYDKFKVDGFDGDFDAFGIPSVKHGLRADLESPQYPERDGTYWIKKVLKIYDESPKYRQTITLDTKV